MRFLKAFSGAIILYILFFVGFSPMSGCKKDILHDTTVRIIHDTAIKDVRDTTIVKDSVYDLLDGLVAYYNFNGGNLNDSSGYNNHIVSNTATQTADRFGNPNNAYLFDGANSYMKVLNSASLNPDHISIFAIVKVNGFSTESCHGNQIIGKGHPDNASGIYALRFADSNACVLPIDSAHERFDAFFGNNHPIGTAEASSDSVYVQKNQWYALTFTYDGFYARFYINGKLKNERPNIIFPDQNGNDVYIGRFEDAVFPYWFNGVIDEIRIYSRALPAEAVKQLSNQKN